MDDNVEEYASGGRVPGEKSEESPVIMELTFQMSALNTTLQTLTKNQHILMKDVLVMKSQRKLTVSQRPNSLLAGMPAA